MTRRNFKRSDEQKREIVSEYESGIPVAQILRKHSISSASLYKWIGEFCLKESECER